MKEISLLILSTSISFHDIESRSLVTSSTYEFSLTDLITPTYWTDWSPCSTTCGPGYLTRKLCIGLSTTGTSQCEKEEQQPCSEVVPCEGEWSEWGKCDYVWGVKTRTKCQEDQCEEEYLDCEQVDKGIDMWSEWGPCTEGVQERMKCMGEEYGCEVEEQNCADIPVHLEGNYALDEERNVKRFNEPRLVKGSVKGAVDDVSDKGPKVLDIHSGWSEWDPCQSNYQARRKCNGGVCEVEERQCVGGREYGEWSAWGDCKDGLKIRSRCSEFEGCVEEEISCGEGDYSGTWARWGACGGGYQRREKCVLGYGCTSEERECRVDSDWSEWSECSEQTQFREKCSYEGCEEETRDCDTPTYHWSTWGECTEDSQQRTRCDSNGCITEERPCVYEANIITFISTPDYEDSTQLVDIDNDWWYSWF